MLILLSRLTYDKIALPKVSYFNKKNTLESLQLSLLIVNFTYTNTKNMNKKNILLVAVTIDGKIARHDNHFSDWTSPEDKQHLHKILDGCDVIVVGNKTYKTAITPLSKRKCIVFTRSVKNTKQVNKHCLYLNPKNIDIKSIISKNKYKNICILGGTSVYSFALENNMVDEIYLTIEPLVFGYGLSLFDANIKNKRKYKLISVKKLNKAGTVLLHYKK